MIYDMFADKAPKSSLFALQSTSETTDNPFNPRLVVSAGDEYWDGSVAYQYLTYDQAVAMRAFLNRLRGAEGQFWFHDYAHKQRSAWAGTPVIDGANQDGILLNVRGLNAGETLYEGDRFQLGDYLHEITQTTTADGAGLAALEFVPDIRVIPADGAALIVTDPKCKCMLYPDQTPPQPSSGKDVITDFSFKFRESLRD